MGDARVVIESITFISLLYIRNKVKETARSTVVNGKRTSIKQCPGIAKYVCFQFSIEC